ncbi:MAG: hypothetical protein KA715_08130 [Xanthomonadaceae bacterium]|nr:hypothetical protein [Xanthomonadaceae bacterium]
MLKPLPKALTIGRVSFSHIMIGSMAFGQRIPTWLKWFLGIVALSVVLPVLGSSGSLLLIILFGGLILFPGKDKSNPNLFKVLPWLWILNWLGSCVLAWNLWVNHFISQPEIDRISGLEIFATLVFTPYLVIAFVKNHRKIRDILVIYAVLAVGASLINAISQPTMELWIDCLGTLIGEIMVISYSWKKLPRSNI